MGPGGAVVRMVAAEGHGKLDGFVFSHNREGARLPTLRQCERRAAVPLESRCGRAAGAVRGHGGMDRPTPMSDAYFAQKI
jgi:hypothetical protein